MPAVVGVFHQRVHRERPPVPAVLHVWVFLMAASPRQHQADVNKSGAVGYAPLHIAVENQHLPCIEALVASGADSRKQDRDGFSPADAATTEPMMRSVPIESPSGVSRAGDPRTHAASPEAPSGDVWGWSLAGDKGCLDPNFFIFVSEADRLLLR